MAMIKFESLSLNHRQFIQHFVEYSTQIFDFRKKICFICIFLQIYSNFSTKFTAPKTVSRPYTGIEPERRVDILVIRPKCAFTKTKIPVAIHLAICTANATRLYVVYDDVRVFIVSFCKLMFMDWDTCVWL